MKKQRLALSVITYTYNDHRLAEGLIASMADWDVAPREIIVVDDGSKIPFAAPPGEPAPRFIRLDPNQGPARAKVAGLSAGGQRFLLSLDADIRLPPDWISRCLAQAANPSIGIVTTPILADVGSGLLADYQKLRYSHMAGFSGNAIVAPAGLWLMRREVWQQYGFHDYQERLHEDVHFSRTLTKAGLALRVLPEPAALQIRRLSRHTMVRRGWTWQGREFLSAASQNPIDPINALLLAMRNRIDKHQAANPAFLYYDILYLAFALTSLLRQAGSPEAAASLPAALADDLPHAAAAMLLRDDLVALGLDVDGWSGGHGGQTTPLVEAVRQGVRSILPEHAAAALEAAMPHLEEENRRGEWDFSFYDGEQGRE